MAFKRRMRWSVFGSLGLHAIVLLLAYVLLVRAQNPVATVPPLTMRFEAPVRAPRLVEPAVSSPEPPKQADAVAVQQAQASDVVPVPDADSSPVLLPKNADLLPSAPPPDLEVAPELAAPIADAEKPATKKPEPEKKKVPPSKSPKKETVVALATPLEEVKSEIDQPAPPAAPVPDVPKVIPGPPNPGSSRGKGIDRVGQTNFSAIEDKMAPYLKAIRKRVEQRWLGALLTRYSGTSPTEAEVYCEIAPDGRLVTAMINGKPVDLVFAAICRRSIEEAGPFGPFTFEVPDIYRDKNLEIRWSFQFL